MAGASEQMPATCPSRSTGFEVQTSKSEAVVAVVQMVLSRAGAS